MSEKPSLLPAETNVPAIEIRDVTKVYRLHSSQTDQLIEVLGLQRLGFQPKSPAKEFPALGGINLTVPKSERIGIVGRNGAGKSTLLKLICGNIKPTSGSIEVNGLVQALLTAGSGFNPDFTGLENVKASLQYNGLNRNDYAAAIEEIQEFCELGNFFDQPFKTYSAGMQARLMFATATAVKPEILIVDEVLGAGDAYFIAKSKRRVEQLVTGGCTMLLVSHAMGQILELCQRTIWIHEGNIHMEGDTFEVVKAYEAFLHGTIQKGGLGPAASGGADAKKKEDGASKDAAQSGDTGTQDAESETYVNRSAPNPDIKRPAIIQDPPFWPGETKQYWPEMQSPVQFNFVTRGGITPWEGTRDLVFSGFTIYNETGETNQLVALRPAMFVLEITAKTAGEYNLRYAVAIFDHQGRAKTRICSSEPDLCYLEEGETRVVSFEVAPLQLGADEYIASLSLHEFEPIEMFNSSLRYDLLSRSFEFSVVMPETLLPTAAEFSHPVQWHFPDDS